jgi:hypothetical protein
MCSSLPRHILIRLPGAAQRSQRDRWMSATSPCVGCRGQVTIIEGFFIRAVKESEKQLRCAAPDVDWFIGRGDLTTCTQEGEVLKFSNQTRYTEILGSKSMCEFLRFF